LSLGGVRPLARGEVNDRFRKLVWSRGRLGLRDIPLIFSDSVGDKASDYDQDQNDDEEHAENPNPRNFSVPTGIENLVQ
jgi:hypothetical protein